MAVLWFCCKISVRQKDSIETHRGIVNPQGVDALAGEEFQWEMHPQR